MANLKDGINSLVEEATKESKPAVKMNPVEKAKVDYNKGKISMGQMDDVAIREFEKKQKSAPTPKVMDDKTYDKVRAAKKAGDKTVRTDKEWQQKVNPTQKPAPWKYTPFKLDTKKYADVKQTPYGYIYNVNGESITDLNAQNRHFAKNDPSFKFDENKDYGFSRTEGGDEVLHTTFDEAYRAIKNKPQPKSYGAKEDGYEGSPMKEFSGPEDSDLSYAQLDAKNNDWKRYFSGDVVEDYGNRAIVQLDNSGKYVLWSKTKNRPISTLNKNYELIPMEYGSVDELKKDERLKGFLPDTTDTNHGDVENAPFVVEADDEKFAFDTEREADSFIERNKYSYSSLKKQNRQPEQKRELSPYKTTLRKAGDIVKLEDGTEAKVIKYYKDRDDYLVRTADGSTYSYDGYDLDRYADPNYSYDESPVESKPEQKMVDFANRVEMVLGDEEITPKDVNILNGEVELIFDSEKEMYDAYDALGSEYDKEFRNGRLYVTSSEEDLFPSGNQREMDEDYERSWGPRSDDWRTVKQRVQEYFDSGMVDKDARAKLEDEFSDWELVDQYMNEIYYRPKAESFLKTNNNLNQRIKEEGINTNLLISKLDNYRTTADVRSIVNGDVGNFKGLSNGEIMDILDNLGYDYELRPSKTGYGKTIYYIPKKK